MKPLVCFLSTLMLVANVEAKGSSNNKASDQAKKLQEQREKDRKERKEKDAKIKDFMEAHDKNHDGFITREELADDKAFDQFDKNKSRFLERNEVMVMLGL